jgi:hypothetical protein
MGSTPGIAANAPEIAYFREYTTLADTGVVKFWNNTIYGGFYATQQFQSAGALPAGDEMKNNIFYMLPISIAVYDLSNGNLTTPANVSNNLVFAPSNNLRVSCAQTAAIGAVRGTTSKSAGLNYFEVQLGYVYAGGDSTFGIANSSQLLSNWIGQSLNGIGYWWSSGNVYINGTVQTTIFTSSPGDVVAVADDRTHGKIWFKNLTKATGWNNAAIGSQDPANNIGGISTSTLSAGPYFIAQSFNSSGDYSILNAGGSPFVGTIPVGFSAWGASTTWNPADIGAPATLTSPIANVSGVGFETFATWQAAGYDAGGVNSDPQFYNAGVDFHQIPTSPTINAGATIATVTTDFDGVARPAGSAYDIGAYEYLKRRYLPLLGAP